MSKGKKVIVVLALLISIGIGYGGMQYISNSKKEDEKPKQVEKPKEEKPYDIIVSKLDFTNLVSDADGKSEDIATSSGINDGKIFVKTIEKYYEFDYIKNPISVNVEYYSERNFCYIYVLTSDKEIYKFKDVDLSKVKNNNYSTIIQKLDISDATSIATLGDYNITSSKMYPALYAKSLDGTIFVSEFDSDFVELNKLIDNPNLLVINTDSLDYSNKTNALFDDAGAGNSLFVEIKNNSVSAYKSGTEYNSKDIIKNPISIRIIGSKSKAGYHIIFILTKEGNLYYLNDENNFENDFVLIDSISNVKSIATLQDIFYTTNTGSKDLYIKTKDGKSYALVEFKLVELSKNEKEEQ